LYNACAVSNSGSVGYGGLFSAVFSTKSHAQQFYDALQVYKGPSLGTNFTLASPYTLLAHYYELDWASNYGVSSWLVRVSVGLEDSMWLKEVFLKALDGIKE
jgi:cystathionine gamma-synthase